MRDRPGPQPESFRAGWAGMALLGSVALVGAMAAAVWLIYPWARQDPIPALLSRMQGPALELTPVADEIAWTRHQQALLAGADGRLPIDRAMMMVVRRGNLRPGDEAGP